MYSQFIRFNCYGAQPGARRKQHENAFDILDEAARLPGATPHLRNPEKPLVHHGVPAESVKTRLTVFAQIARNERGARLRRDGTLLYAIVVSYPEPWTRIEDEEARAVYHRWRHESIEWLKRQFGECLASVIEHVDEARPHIHAFVIPPVCPRNRIDHRLHPGHVARAASRRAGGDRVAGERAWRSGMRAWQNDYFEAVSSRFGHARLGPRRKRFRRDVMLVRHTIERFLAMAENVSAKWLARLDATPDMVTPEERADFAEFAALFSRSRQHLLEGRPDALKALAMGLEALASDQDGADGVGKAEPAPEPGPLDWEGDDDPRPEEAVGLDMIADDDPDPEAYDPDDLDADLAAEDGYDWEPQDWSDEIEAQFDDEG